MEIQNISGPDAVIREFSAESAPRQERPPEPEVERAPESETKGASVDAYA